MKAIVTIFLFITALSGFAQKKQNVYFFNDYRRLASIDSATFIRIVAEPDSGSELYNVTDFYKNGKRKLIGKSLTIDPQKFQGQLATFHENGKRKAVIEYNDNRPVGDEYDYFPNARPSMIKTHYKEKKKDGSFEYGFLLTASYDSLGNQQVTDGNGYFKGHIRDYADSDLFEEGAIKNGRRDGEWKGKYKKGTFVESYKNDVLFWGAYTDEKGVVTKYTERDAEPKFPNGPAAFNDYLSQAIRYPTYEREHNITGKVFVSFIVEKDGRITNVEVAIPISPGLDIQSAEAVKTSPRWIPGKTFGQLARITFTVPINFTLTDAK